MFGRYAVSGMLVLSLILVSTLSWSAPTKHAKAVKKTAKVSKVASHKVSQGSLKAAKTSKPTVKSSKAEKASTQLAAACSDVKAEDVSACETGEKLNTGLGRWLDGRWRVEVSAAAFPFGERPVNRAGDSYYTASVEYEIPIFERFTIGPRFYPAVLYHEYSHPMMYAPALGIAGRVYANAAERRGLFGEIGAASMWQSRYLEQNTSRHNFLLVLGVGYQFRNNVHTTLSVQHISNAYTASENNGVNMAGFGVGYTF